VHVIAVKRFVLPMSVLSVSVKGLEGHGSHIDACIYDAINSHIQSSVQYSWNSRGRTRAECHWHRISVAVRLTLIYSR